MRAPFIHSTTGARRGREGAAWMRTSEEGTSSSEGGTEGGKAHAFIHPIHPIHSMSSSWTSPPPHHVPLPFPSLPFLSGPGWGGSRLGSAGGGGVGAEHRVSLAPSWKHHSPSSSLSSSIMYSFIHSSIHSIDPFSGLALYGGGGVTNDALDEWVNEWEREKERRPSLFVS